MKGEVCQLHNKISLGLRHGFSELLSFPSFPILANFEQLHRQCCHLATFSLLNGKV